MKDWLSRSFLLLLSLSLFTACNALASEGPNQEIIVYAAASLTESFQEIEKEYEGQHPGIDIVLNFAGSQMLFNQIKSGGRADLYFSANLRYPDQLVADGVEGCMEVDNYGTNTLVLIGKDIKGDDFTSWMEGLQRENPRIVIAHESVPVGSYTVKMMDNYLEMEKNQETYEFFYNHVVSYENDVKSIVTKVVLGEADYGIVYVSDYMAIKDKPGIGYISIPESFNIKAQYGSILIEVTDETKDLYDYILTGKGQEILNDFGF